MVSINAVEKPFESKETAAVDESFASMEFDRSPNAKAMKKGLILDLDKVAIVDAKPSERNGEQL